MFKFGKNNSPIADQLVDLLPNIWRFALSLSGNPEIADELTQATCLRAIEKSTQFTAKGSLIGWCLTICRSIWLNEMRAQTVRDTGNIALATIAGLEPVTATTDTQLFAREIIQKIMALPEAQRVTVELVYVQEYTYSEAANILDIPIGTVMSRLHAARKALKTHADIPKTPARRISK